MAHRLIEPIGQFVFDHPFIVGGLLGTALVLSIGAVMPEIKRYEPRFKAGDVVYHKHSGAKGFVVRSSCPTRSNRCSASVRFTDTSHEAVWTNEWELRGAN